MRLEDQLGSQLEFARIVGRGDLPKVPRSLAIAETAISSASSQLGMVPGVEGVGTEGSWSKFRPNPWLVDDPPQAIQRKISRVLILNLLYYGNQAVLRTAQDHFVLDSTFALVEAPVQFLAACKHANELIQGKENRSHLLNASGSKE